MLRHATKQTQPPSQTWPLPAEMAPNAPNEALLPATMRHTTDGQ